jgi:hypothetical protein
MIPSSLKPLKIMLGSFQILKKFATIFTSQGALQELLTLVVSLPPVSTTLVVNLPLVSGDHNPINFKIVVVSIDAATLLEYKVFTVPTVLQGA